MPDIEIILNEPVPVLVEVTVPAPILVVVSQMGVQGLPGDCGVKISVGSVFPPAPELHEIFIQI